ncbi:DP-EP family protein [Shewanella sp. NIFS-20-20]|uniref:DP-EP family protein n=1 Tax=Shewanella sp. NIFS-20-20 TaxID=2853806 RepID=UPI001C456307|nr:DP-EP family protein [Shewanella sp. NIFS-20-20]MBV7316833.1 DP-EP family protein [Shewanella sp. NIFS-20-20]
MPEKNITVTVSLDNAGTPQFVYEPAGPVVVTESNTQIVYHLIDNTAQGLSFAGASFSTPFDRIIDAVNVEPTVLTLQDTDEIYGKTGFRLVFNIAGSSLLLSSHDPAVINKERH